ncbi:HAD family hydrolase [Evansella cellulosilytica]|uniref:Cof-like hydrolase n=1 Tax=Evansella cellulosilytica (strain ATCC 21833 / DSM 2522 / FERM P-1141 / JCM 9156 / N-4) TaxID=649639 RepID=E6TYA8_EVAC2|nr:HAD family hydrolase [Evansella cellulosilytica]ADU28846.1 Cof-like hydrolase [Evansella cellulosilytica DSM 2522]
MDFKPKAIFLDMDGTILNHDNKVTIRTKEIIDEIRKSGIYVFVATGRALNEIPGVIPDGFEVDAYITSNGMAGYVGDEAVFEHSLSRELVELIIEKARENKMYYELFPYEADRITLKQDKVYVVNEIREPKPHSVGINEWSSRKQAVKSEIAWKDQVEGEKFSKFYFFSRSKDHINRWKEVLEELKKQVDFSTSISSKHNVELMVANVNKATGIKQMLKHFQLTEEDTIAMGDSNNDLPMFDFVSYAVAMKNAPSEIKEKAQDVTQFTCDEDGVYHYLKSMLVL